MNLIPNVIHVVVNVPVALVIRDVVLNVAAVCPNLAIVLSFSFSLDNLRKMR